VRALLLVGPGCGFAGWGGGEFRGFGDGPMTVFGLSLRGGV